MKSQIIELGHPSPLGRGRHGSQEAVGQGEGLGTFSSLRSMVLQSVGPMRHEVSVPFHDSQVRGVALLIQTGWDQHWDTEAYWQPGPFLGEHLIFRCVRSGVRVVGVDFPTSERTNETRLIMTGKIPVIENLHGFASLPRTGFRFSAILLEESSGAPLPVRAFAEIP